jgi:hypothetical protein
MRVHLVALALSLAAALPAVASASEPITGRWALGGADCDALAARSLVVTRSNLRWQGESCRIARMYKTGAVVHIQAKCWDRSGLRSVPVSLRPYRGGMELHWNRVAAGDLRRCR